ncbi:hypothetical protein ACFO0N_08740 [Halobium salinum]|uniref:Uncharacterized protein n=1 Tax=Halobium salinum TaxID=1364940 RepID=A0ABD5PAY5_9EURY|nr:hypothetical protein [Halobium salinum]
MVAVAVVVLSAGGTAQTDTRPAWADEVYADLVVAASAYNAAPPDPTLAGLVFADERVNLHVHGDGDELAAYSFRTDADLRVVELDRGERADATTLVTTGRETVATVADAPSPPSALVGAVEAGDVRIRGIGPLAGVKWALVGLGVALIDLGAVGVGLAVAGVVGGLLVLYLFTQAVAVPSLASVGNALAWLWSRVEWGLKQLAEKLGMVGAAKWLLGKLGLLGSTDDEEDESERRQSRPTVREQGDSRLPRRRRRTGRRGS